MGREVISEKLEVKSGRDGERVNVQAFMSGVRGSGAFFSDY